MGSADSLAACGLADMLKSVLSRERVSAGGSGGSNALLAIHRPHKRVFLSSHELGGYGSWWGVKVRLAVALSGW